MKWTIGMHQRNLVQKVLLTNKRLEAGQTSRDALENNRASQRPLMRGQQQQLHAAVGPVIWMEAGRVWAKCVLKMLANIIQTAQLHLLEHYWTCTWLGQPAKVTDLICCCWRHRAWNWIETPAGLKEKKMCYCQVLELVFIQLESTRHDVEEFW